MDIFKWRESYATGVSAMDTQHQKLIELISQLYKVLRNKESQSAVKDVLQEMSSYAEHHFVEEEKFLKENNFPDYESHAALHQGYMESLQVLMDDTDMDETEQMREIYTFLRKWWMDHILGEDKLYGEFMSSNAADKEG